MKVRAEITRRVDAVKKEMRANGLQSLIIFSQVVLGDKAAVRYISDYRLLTRKDYLVLPLTGEPMLVVPTLGQKLSALQVSWIQDIRSGGDTGGMVREIAAKIRQDGHENAVIGIVGLSGMPYEDYELLKNEFPQVLFTDATRLLNDIRAVKSTEEIEMIRTTTQIADASYELLIDLLRTGMDELEGFAEVNKLLTLKGVEDILILTSKGRAFPCFIAPPGPYVFKDGDHYVFSIEISGPGGYWSQIVRPLCLGKPSPSYERLFEVGKKALDAGVSRLVPGARLGDVARIISAEARDAGYNTGVWSGHGMGMDLGDGIGIFENSTFELKEGMVITIHPHIISGDGKEGLLLGDTYVITKNGAENLSRTKCELKCL
ncbi:MAG TPA: Xaa-Pro peptidase family protein [Syntrophorhabdaceae bacterium]|nr:Xaa-Pro peptidase family protein [Syntrophorhabdaceae bacterium]